MPQAEKLRKLARTHSKRLKVPQTKLHDLLSSPDKRFDLLQIFEILEGDTRLGKDAVRYAQGLFLAHCGLSPALPNQDNRDLPASSLGALQHVDAYECPLDLGAFADCFAYFEEQDRQVASVHIITKDFKSVPDWDDVAVVPFGAYKRPEQGYMFDVWDAAVFVDPELPPGRTYFCAEGAVKEDGLDASRVFVLICPKRSS